MKLISMVNFVSEQFSKMMNSTNPALLQKELFTDPVMNYSNFLSLPRTLSMFVPTDEEGNFLEEPLLEHYKDCTDEQNHKDFIYNLQKYQKAKQNVIFEGFEYKNKCLWFFDGVSRRLIFTENLGFDSFTTIESLIPYNLTITKEAVEKFKLK